MPVLFLLLLLLSPGYRALHRAGAASAARRIYRLLSWILGGMILGAMAAQEIILLRAGMLSWASALPLHLCSLMGLLALPALISRRELLLHVLFYAGAPGALLALLFPAIADTPWPGWTAFFFHLMHAGLLCTPVLPLLLGWRPRPEGALQTWLLLLGTGAAAMAVNRLTGGNYLFLSGPVAGTPLMCLARWGLPVYRLLLALAAGMLLAAEGFIVHRMRLLMQR